jgi:nitrate reductase gamma subunit
MLIKDHYSIMAITIGIALVILTAISYLAIWHPRLSRKHWVTEDSRWRDVFGSVPWVLIITYVGSALIAVIVTIYYSFNVPNW